MNNSENPTNWNVENYENRLRDYRNETKENNQPITEQGWLDRVKDNVSDAWEDTKDAASEAWQKTKNWTEDAWENTKDAAEDVKAEVRKSTN